MSMRVYAMYLGSKIVLGILVAMILARIALGLAVCVVILGPQSGVSGTSLFPHSSPFRHCVCPPQSDRMDPFWYLRLRSEGQHEQPTPVRMGHPHHRHQRAPLHARRRPLRQARPRHAADAQQVDRQRLDARARARQYPLLLFVRPCRSAGGYGGARADLDV